MNGSSKRQAYVAITSNPDGTACVAIHGDIDLAAEPVLDDALSRLATEVYRALYIDLASTGFAGSTLIHFVHRVIDSMPPYTPILLCRPRRVTRLLITLCGLDALTPISRDLPTGYAVSAPAVSVSAM